MQEDTLNELAEPFTAAMITTSTSGPAETLGYFCSYVIAYKGRAWCADNKITHKMCATALGGLESYPTLLKESLIIDRPAKPRSQRRPPEVEASQPQNVQTPTPASEAIAS